MATRLLNWKSACGQGLRYGLRVGYVGLWLGLLGGAGYGVTWCRHYAMSLPQYQKAPTVKLAGLPDWLRRAENQPVVAEVLSAASVGPSDKITDHELAVRIAQGLAECPWVREVKSVRKTAEAVVQVECEYRMPVAWVEQDDTCRLIDEYGVRLPGSYRSDRIRLNETGMPVLVGIAEPPPEVGRVWPGEDVAAGLRMARVLHARPVQRQVSAIDVGNYRGRRDPLAPDIKLLTERRNSEILWGHAPGEEYEAELMAHQKLDLLEDNMRRFGRIDRHKRYMDIRTAPAFQPADRPDEAAGESMAREPHHDAASA